MKRLLSIALLLVLLLAVVPVQFAAHAQAAPRVIVSSQYTLNRYGYAVVDENVRFENNESSAVQVPSVTIGFGSLSSDIVAYNLRGSGFTVMSGNSSSGPFTIGGGQPLAAGADTSYVLSVLLNGVVSTAKNGTLEVAVLAKPSLDLKVDVLQNSVRMPLVTQFSSAPSGLIASQSGQNVTYSGTLTNVSPGGAAVVVKPIRQAGSQDFHPLVVYSASRTISVGPGGSPTVTDSLTFKNVGTTKLQSLTVSPLTISGGRVTVIPAAEPRLLNPASVLLSANALDLTNNAIGNPVPAGGNYTISYEYPLQAKYYSVTGGQVTINVPMSPPIAAFVGSYSIVMSVPAGVVLLQSGPKTLTGVTPWLGGQARVAYGLSVGWAVGAGIPVASTVFVLLLIGLFVSKTTLTEEEESEEESSTELASTMIKAFEEKTSLINGLWPEISSADPNELDKEYFDELRGRVDAFRSRALQRLNEVRQKSTSQKFFELLGQIQTTEREVERAAKDKLNLYEQFYTRRMRKEVFDRLLPQYNKRLEKALNQLSDELHVVQREAKLL